VIQKHTKHTLFAVSVDRFALLNRAFWVAVFVNGAFRTVCLSHCRQAVQVAAYITLKSVQELGNV
jgi:hypothetical protein